MSLTPFQDRGNECEGEIADGENMIVRISIIFSVFLFRSEALRGAE